MSDIVGLVGIEEVDICAVWSVPWIITSSPRNFLLERGEQEVERPGYDGIVVHGYVTCYDTYSKPYTC